MLKAILYDNYLLPFSNLQTLLQMLMDTQAERDRLKSESNINRSLIDNLQAEVLMLYFFN